MAYTNAELQQLLQGASQFGMNQIGGPSFVDQYRNARQSMSLLKGLNVGTDITQRQYNAAKAGIKNTKGSAIAGGVMAGLSGAADILNNTFNMSQIADTSGMENQIQEVGQIGNQQYTNFDQLNADFEKLASSPMHFDYDDIRGKSDGELAGGVISSTLSGASAGMTIGGPWGALAGGVVGLGSGIIGVVSGNKDAERKQEQMELDARIASDTARQNLSLANENLMDYNFRAGVSNRADEGGKIDRVQAVKNFASRAMRKSARYNVKDNVPIQARHAEGGTIIRIKR